MSALTDRLSKLGNGTGLPDPSAKPLDLDKPLDKQPTITRVVGNPVKPKHDGPSVAALCSAVSETSMRLGDIIDKAERVNHRLNGGEITSPPKLQVGQNNPANGLLQNVADEGATLLDRLTQLDNLIESIDKAVG